MSLTFFRDSTKKRLSLIFVDKNSIFSDEDRYFFCPVHWCRKKKEKLAESNALFPPLQALHRLGSSCAHSPTWSSGFDTILTLLALCIAVCCLLFVHLLCSTATFRAQLRLS